MADQQDLYALIGILTFLTIVGSFGNAIVMYVYYKKNDKMASSLFILSLAVVDFITCFVIIPMTIFMEYVDFYVGSHDMLCKIYMFFTTSNVPFSAMVMVIIAVDRYFCICHPFMTVLTKQRAKIVVMFLVSIVIAIGITVSLSYGVYDAPADSNRIYDTNNFSENALAKNNSIKYFNQTQSGIANITQLQCHLNNQIISKDFIMKFQKGYLSIFMVCGLSVIVLYSFILKEVVYRRALRDKRHANTLKLLPGQNIDGKIQENAPQICQDPSTANCSQDDKKTNDDIFKKGTGVNNNSNNSSLRSKDTSYRSNQTSIGGSQNNIGRSNGSRRHIHRDSTFIANLRTAAMLFVVAMVYIMSYIPTCLMILKIVPYQYVVYNLYFMYNAANPLIYSFMNPIFRNDLKKIFNSLFGQRGHNHI
ncbi:unnamed protein product [Owenia fusiformis]|uniref:G-protein coupled receptors family 1 profile domain-containing protein n=1 Tax=Owenia fusiformis TaxID=6347 RepID=A0A8S4N0Y3_OWEFU|nr:unnamed protein product [Owenia fusiformis]